MRAVRYLWVIALLAGCTLNWGRDPPEPTVMPRYSGHAVNCEFCRRMVMDPCTGGESFGCGNYRDKDDSPQPRRKNGGEETLPAPGEARPP